MILPWRNHAVLSAADQKIQANVAHCLKVMEEYRSLDRRRGYAEGRHNGFYVGFATAAALAAIGAILVAVL
jgi:hypothetical protein